MNRSLSFDNYGDYAVAREDRSAVAVDPDGPAAARILRCEAMAQPFPAIAVRGKMSAIGAVPVDLHNPDLEPRLRDRILSARAAENMSSMTAAVAIDTRDVLIGADADGPIDLRTAYRARNWTL